tara:strand:- start:298 stop:573 length:276 start_codon:yes stop_codon:yes gene_type:complete
MPISLGGTNWSIETVSKASATDNFSVETVSKASTTDNWFVFGLGSDYNDGNQWRTLRNAYWESQTESWGRWGAANPLVWTIDGKSKIRDSD